MQGNERKSHHLSIQKKGVERELGMVKETGRAREDRVVKQSLGGQWRERRYVQAAGVSGPVQELFYCMTRMIYNSMMPTVQ